MHGGLAGATGAVTVFRRGTGAGLCANKTDDLKLYPGDEVLVETGGGGGYGLPTERPVEDVVRDVRRGYVSAESARRDFGISIAADGTGTRRTEH